MKKNKKLIGIIALLPLFWNLNTSVVAMELVVTGNGDGSTSEINTTVQTTTQVTQQNQGEVSNDINANANTGENEANSNSGQVNIETGDAQSDVEVQNSLNNSTVVYEGCCENDTSLQIYGNGSESENNINLESNSNNQIQVTQNAKVTNNISGFVNSGNNSSNDNNGSVEINTGSAKVTGGVYNGPVNVSSVKFQAGGPTGVFAKIGANGSGSVNNLFANFNNDSTISVLQNAQILNFVNWYANTGGNSANDNNGDVIIRTGDSIINFVINNYANQSDVVYDGCCDDSKVTPMVTPNPSPSPSPTPDPGDDGDGGNGDGGGNGDSGGGSVNGGSTAVVAAAHIQDILGLSDTSSGHDSMWRTYLGYALILLGMSVLLPRLRGSYDKRI